MLQHNFRRVNSVNSVLRCLPTGSGFLSSEYIKPSVDKKQNSYCTKHMNRFVEKKKETNACVISRRGHWREAVVSERQIVKNHYILKAK